MAAFEIAPLTAADVTHPSDDLLRAVNRFDNQMWAESDPDEPPYSLPVTKMKLTDSWHGFEHRRWMATDAGGEVAAMARVDLHVGVDDDPNASVTLQAARPFRRRGLGSSVLREVVAWARPLGRSNVGVATTDRVPAGAAFAEWIGAVPKLVQRESECRLDEIDRAMIARWIDVPDEVGREYELWRTVGPYPEEEYARIAEIQNVMNTQPFDDLDRRDVHFTADHIAHREATRDWSLGERWTHFIRHRPSGRLAGYTRVYLHNDWPGMAEQGDTGVDPVHRGRGLVKLLKGSMVHHLLTERPDTTRIRTSNAFTNGPMLAINEALGFKVTKTLTDWQAPMATVAARLGMAPV